MSSNFPDELDRLLDEALAGYSSEEPRSGLEQRVLSRVRASSTGRRLMWWRWALAIPALALLSLLAIQHKATPPRATAERIRSVVQAPVLGGLTTAASLRPAPARPARPGINRRVVSQPVVRQGDVFPRVLPLSPEERALVDLVTRHPKQARELLTKADLGVIEPIEIPRIQVLPLTGGSEQ